MNRLLSVNLVLTGILLGVLMAWACGNEQNAPTTPSAYAQTWDSSCERWRIVELDVGISDNAFQLADFTLPAGHEYIHLDYAWFGGSGDARPTAITRVCAD